MELGLCEQYIQNAYTKNPAGLENISQLTSSARGVNKLECVQKMWWVTQIKNFLLGNPYTPAKTTTGPWFTTTPSEKDQTGSQTTAANTVATQQTGRKNIVND